MGIDQLTTSTDQLDALLLDIERLETESVKATSQISTQHARDLKTLGTIWGRIVNVDKLMTEFEETDQKIMSIQKFLSENPDGFSINCFNAIQKVLLYKSEILAQNLNPDSMTFIKEHFEPVDLARGQLMRNVERHLSNAFSGPGPVDPDLVIRANWILIAEGRPEQIKQFLSKAVCQQFNQILLDPTPENLTKQLKKLNQRIETLPEQLEAIIPALPPIVNAFDLLSTVANTQIVSILKSLWNDLPKTAFLALTLIKAVKDITLTLRALLGVETSDDFRDLQIDLQADFGSLLQNDYRVILERTRDFDASSIETNKSGCLVTPAPRDFLRHLEDARNFVKTAPMDVFASNRRQLIGILLDSINKVRVFCVTCMNRQYLIACANNAIEARPAVTEFQKAHEDILSKEDAQEVVRAWLEVQKTAIVSLWRGIFMEVVGPLETVDLAAFRAELYENLQKINDILIVVRKQIGAPIFAKFLTQFVKFLIAQLIHSYLKFKIVKEGFPDTVKDECDHFCDFVRDLEYGSNENHLRTITNLCLFLTEEPGQAFMSYLVLLQEFTDFRPDLGWKLLTQRPDPLGSKSEIVESFKMQVNSVERNPEDHYFSESSEEDTPKSKKGKK
jgi:hypothetical protein